MVGPGNDFGPENGDSSDENLPEVNVRVALRCRPMSENEIKKGCESIVTCDEYNSTIYVDIPQNPNNNQGVNIANNKATRRAYRYDGVYGPFKTQKDFYQTVVSPIIDDFLNGFNCTIFAYGQTGSGKTHTMEGPPGVVLKAVEEKNFATNEEDAKIEADLNPDLGVIPRAVDDIFRRLSKQDKTYTLRISNLEIYNEELNDLLCEENGPKKPLRIFERKNIVIDEQSEKIGVGGISIQNLTDYEVRSPSDVLDFIALSSMRRTVGETLLNARSSRSHSIFMIVLNIRETSDTGSEIVKISKLNLVDLAGSENISRSGAVNVRAREAGKINQSLLTLGKVINALVERRSHVPYRESKLTRILQDSLGGNTKTVIVATVSPSSSCLEETLSTLDYMSRAKKIKNRPTLNAKVISEDLIKQYMMVIAKLQKDLKAAREGRGFVVDEDEYNEMVRRLEEQDALIEEMTNEALYNGESGGTGGGIATRFFNALRAKYVLTKGEARFVLSEIKRGLNVWIEKTQLAVKRNNKLRECINSISNVLENIEMKSKDNLDARTSGYGLANAASETMLKSVQDNVGKIKAFLTEMRAKIKQSISGFVTEISNTIISIMNILNEAIDKKTVRNMFDIMERVEKLQDILEKNLQYEKDFLMNKVNENIVRKNTTLLTEINRKLMKINIEGSNKQKENYKNIKENVLNELRTIQIQDKQRKDSIIKEFLGDTRTLTEEFHLKLRQRVSTSLKMMEKDINERCNSFIEKNNAYIDMMNKNVDEHLELIRKQTISIDDVCKKDEELIGKTIKKTIDITGEQTNNLIKNIKDEIVNKFITDEFKAKHNIDSLKLNKEINDIPPFISNQLLKYRQEFSVLIDNYKNSAGVVKSPSREVNGTPTPSSPTQRIGTLSSMLRSPKSSNSGLSGSFSDSSVNEKSVRNQMRINITDPLLAEGKNINDEITKEFKDSTEIYCKGYGKKKESFSNSISKQNIKISQEIEKLRKEISLTLIRKDRSIPRAPEYVLKECLPSMSEAATRIKEKKSLESVNIIRSSTPLANKLAKIIEPRAIDLTTEENIPVPVPVEETMGEIREKYNTNEPVKLLFETGIDTTEVDIKKEVLVDGKEKELPDFDFNRYSYINNFNPEELERGRKIREKLNRKYNEKSGERISCSSTLSTPRKINDFNRENLSVHANMNGNQGVPCASSSAMMGDASYEHNDNDKNLILNRGEDFNENLVTPRKYLSSDDIKDMENKANNDRRSINSSDSDFIDNYTQEEYLNNTAYYKNKEEALNSMCLGEIKRESERLKPFVSPRYIDPENKAYKTDLDMLYLSIKNGKYGKEAAAASSLNTSASKSRSSSLTKSRQKQTAAMLQSRIKARQVAQKQDENLIVAVPYRNSESIKKSVNMLPSDKQQRKQNSQTPSDSLSAKSSRSTSRLSTIPSPRPSTGAYPGRVSIIAHKTATRRPPTQGGTSGTLQQKYPSSGISSQNVEKIRPKTTTKVSGVSTESKVSEYDGNSITSTIDIIPEAVETKKVEKDEKKHEVDGERHHHHRSHHSSTSSTHSHKKHSKSKHDNEVETVKQEKVSSPSKIPTIGSVSIGGIESTNYENVDDDTKARIHRQSSSKRATTSGIIRPRGTRPAGAPEE